MRRVTTQLKAAKESNSLTTSIETSERNSLRPSHKYKAGKCYFVGHLKVTTHNVPSTCSVNNDIVLPHVSTPHEDLALPGNVTKSNVHKTNQFLEPLTSTPHLLLTDTSR